MNDKKQGRLLRRAAAIGLICALLGGWGCASKKAGVDSPQLPARHWLQEAPGVPVAQKPRLEAAIAGLYSPDKVFGFEECVFLAIQQSPLLVNSAVELEIKRVARTDAVWKYLPEPRMTFSIVNNLTRNNTGARDRPRQYGQTKYDVGFYTQFPNPVKTYFEHSAQNIMVDLALATHRKAVGETIYRIAGAYMKLDAQRRINRIQEVLPEMSRALVRYWEQVESVDGRQGVELTVARQRVREAELKVEKGRMQETVLLTDLKMTAGVDPRQRLNVDAADADKILRGFDGGAQSWEDRWAVSEDQALLRNQIRLADYNIMVSWAEYVPNLTVSVNKTPPSGQHQPVGGQEDHFLHLTFDIPLIDWGRRYRGVQTARMQKAQAFHKQANARTDYSNTWLQAEQRVALADTNARIARVQFDTAEMKFKEAEISFAEGLAPMPAMVGAREAMINAQAALVDAEREARLARLHWMFVAGLLQEHFLGLPAKEEK